jgi:hypothetical protein
MSPENQKPINRYPGVKPFSAKEDTLFFGRDNDIASLISRIFLRQTVVLLGKSGYGKSSLINAGVIPALKAESSWTYFTIRFNNYSDKEGKQNLPPSETVRQRLKECAGNDLYADFKNLIAGEDSFWYWVKQNQANNKNSKFIFFFDQFEELFTYPTSQVTDFAEQLSELLYDDVPTKYKIKISELYEQDLLDDRLHGFIDKNAEIKVVFSIRSDRLSLMNGLKDRLPAILQNCYELDALNTNDARKAITEPAKLSKELGFETPEFSFTDKAIDKILATIANPQDGKIEAATLQIVCRYVEDNLVAIKNLTLIDENNLGNITKIIQQYYTDVLSKLSEEEKLKAQLLIEDELIIGDKRNSLLEEYIISLEKIGVSSELLTKLEQSSLLRKERDASGRILYEISHDSLVSGIKEVAQGRRVQEEEKEGRRRKEEDDKKKTELEKKYAEEKRNTEKLLRLNRQIKNMSRIAWGLAIVCIIVAVFAASLRKEAVKQTIIAKEALNDLKKQNAKNKAIELMNIGDGLMNEQGTNYKKYALIRYNEGLKVIANYINDSLYYELSKKVESCKK